MPKVYTCENCSVVFEDHTKHAHRRFCGQKCCGEFQVKRRLRKGTIMNKCMRKWLYGHLEQKCFSCGLGLVWNGKPLRLQLDHANGDNRDNRIENFRMICPNCHTQTHTWGVKNCSKDGRKRMVEGALYLSSLKTQIGVEEEQQIRLPVTQEIAGAAPVHPANVP